MNEIALLKSIQREAVDKWIEAKATALEKSEKILKFSIRRSEQLIVPFVSYANSNGSLNNDNWAYKVPYAFHDALDIRFTGKVSHWTQGGLLAFSEGDFFEAIGDKPSLQVVSAKPMVWDDINEVIDNGEVTYQSFIKIGLGDFFTVSQFEFLRVLIYGKH